jgi:hypothetical protein
MHEPLEEEKRKDCKNASKEMQNMRSRSFSQRRVDLLASIRADGIGISIAINSKLPGRFTSPSELEHTPCTEMDYA